MTDSVRLIAMRLAVAFGFTVEPDYFPTDIAWALVAQFEAAMNAQRKLDPSLLVMLEDLSIALNARGGDETVFHTLLEGQFGPSPFPPETIVAIVRFVRAQLHFTQKKTGVDLDPKNATWVPNKNYEFK